MAVQYKGGPPDGAFMFQAAYQAPFGGLDSSAYASAINPANFPFMDSIFIEDNQINPLQYDLIPINSASNTITGNYMGFIPVSPSPAFVSPYTIGYIITDTGVYGVGALSATNDFIITSLVSYAPARTGTSFGFNYIVIDDQYGNPNIYWTTNNWFEVWTYNSMGGATLLENYVGGGILGLLNNQFIVLGGTSFLDGLVPNRISWSAPGQYGQFQPYDVSTGTGSYAAGFNDLPSTSDYLTGFAAIGTVGYIFRAQGITQMNITGNGVQPFAFNHLWASQLGIGSPFPNSVAQYGSFVIFATDVGIYNLGIGGLSEIGTSARASLYRLLNNQQVFTTGQINQQLVAVVIPFVLNSPELFYIMAIGSLRSSFNVPYYQFIAIKISDGSLYNMGQQLVQSQVTSQLSLKFYQPDLFSGNPGAHISTRKNPLLVYNSPTGVKFGTFDQGDNNFVGTVYFKKEQMKFGYMPTVTKCAVIGALIDITQDGFVGFSVDGGLSFSQFPQIQIPHGINNPGNGIFDNIYSDAVQTLERPQLAIQLSNVKIIEAWYQGILADYELI